MKIAVLGGSGFIGRHVMEHINNLPYSPDYADALDLHSSYEDERLDVTDRRQVWDRLESYDAVINLAGLLGTHELFDNVQAAIDVNISGAYNVASFCAKVDIPLVTVEQPHVWTNPYETTRGAGVRLARGLAYAGQLNLATVTAYNAFGEGQAYGPGHPLKFVPAFSVQAHNREWLRIYGDGKQGVNLVYVKDLARIFYEAIEWADHSAPEFMGASVGGNKTVNQVAKMISQYVSPELLHGVQYLPMRDGETNNEGAYAHEINTANKGRVHVPEFRVEDLHRTVDWYKGIDIDGSTEKRW